MAWRLARWKACDGGCSVRSPTFPDETNKRTVPGRHEDYMAGDRHKLNELGGTTPDGGDWVGGNALHREVWALYEAKGRDASRITPGGLQALANFGQLFALDWPLQGIWKGNAIQYFLDRDFGWPVRGPHVQAILDRMAELGLWDSTLYDPGLSYDEVYDDDSDELEIVGGHLSIRSQLWHVEDAMTQAEKEAEEPACCHYWERV